MAPSFHEQSVWICWPSCVEPPLLLNTHYLSGGNSGQPPHNPNHGAPAQTLTVSRSVSQDKHSRISKMLIVPVISFLLYFVLPLRACSLVFVVFRHVCFYLLSCGPQIRFSLWHYGVFLPAEEIHRDSLAMFMQGVAHSICICILKCPMLLVPVRGLA